MLSSIFISVPTANMCKEEVQRGESEMKIDFASLNLQYLIQVRDIAREDPDVAARLLGLPPELACHLAQVKSLRSSCPYW